MLSFLINIGLNNSYNVFSILFASVTTQLTPPQKTFLLEESLGKHSPGSWKHLAGLFPGEGIMKGEV